MKKTLIIILALVSIVLSFFAGRRYEAKYGQAYQDACKMSDCIRCYEDMKGDTVLLEGVVLDKYAFCY